MLVNYSKKDTDNTLKEVYAVLRVTTIKFNGFIGEKKIHSTDWMQ